MQINARTLLLCRPRLSSRRYNMGPIEAGRREASATIEYRAIVALWSVSC